MRRSTWGRFPTIRFARRSVLTAIVLLSLIPAAHAQQKQAEARAQFERAEKMRTAVEGRPQSARTLEDYQRLAAAYRKVYLITPQGEEVTLALRTVGELYAHMGRQFDAEYYQSAVDAYRFLIKEYPGSKYSSDALFTIARIQQEDLDELDNAQASFQDFLRHYPHSPKVEDARQALVEIADAQEKQNHSGSSRKLAEQRARQQELPRVTNIRTWNAENYTRVVVDLEDTVQYHSARIKNPERIYFDLSTARLGPALAGKTIDVQNGFLKAIRVAQNQKGVVRLVLDLDSVKEYSAFLLPDPYRLVIDVHGQALEMANAPKPAPKDKSESNVIAEKPPERPAEKPAEKVVEEKPAEKKNAGESASNAGPQPDDALSARGSGRAHHDTTAMPSAVPPKPTRGGQQSLTRALGLKISRIVIDPGHGGSDTGTIGPHGMMEKDVCLDVALRLGRLIQERLPGAEVIYTRKDDTFVPLEVRTALANQDKADLFISIHANSSHDHAARGVETYYLNFATSQDAMEVAARENALSQSSIHELQDLLTKIARNEKIEESKEFASDVQESLTKRLQQTSRSERDRGVKKAPFVVLIGANMPSILAEISFLSNPNDERMLKKPDQRQRVAEGLFRGVETYLDSLNSLSYNRQKLVSIRQ
jgi:N-acetylmuramoyl-L-alanine amidase